LQLDPESGLFDVDLVLFLDLFASVDVVAARRIEVWMGLDGPLCFDIESAQRI
jgi:hypothetical protein